MSDALRVAVVGSLLLVAPRPAQACTRQPSVSEVVPSTPVVHPANAALLFFGYWEQLGLGVTVDGVSAAFEAPEAWKTFAPSPGNMLDAFTGVRLVQPPEPGAQVTWSWDPAACEKATGKACEVHAPISYVVGASDVEPPAPPLALSFDLHDYPDVRGDTCTGVLELRYEVHVQGPPQDAGSPLVLAVRGRPIGHMGPELEWFTPPGPEPFTVAFNTISEPFGEVPAAAAYCFTVFTVDLAGNMSSAGLEACAPCQMSTDEDAPVWSDADLFPGGQCVAAQVGEVEAGTGEPTGSAGTSDDSTSGGSEDAAGGGAEMPDDGCACGAAGAGSPWMLAPLLLGWRRRRR